MFLHFRVSVVLNDTMQGLEINMSCEEEFGIKLCTYEEDYEELDVSMYKASKSKVSHEDLVIEVNKDDSSTKPLMIASAN